MAEASTSPLYLDVETGERIQKRNAGTQGVDNAPINNTNKEGGGRLMTLIRILRLHSFLIAFFTFFLLVSIRFILYHAPLQTYFGFYKAKRVTTVLAIWMFAAMIFSFMAAYFTNFKRMVSPWRHLISIVVDGVLAVGIIISAVHFTDQYPHGLWCSPYEGHDPHPQCWSWKNITWLLMKISFTLSIIISIILVALIICHIHVIGGARSGAQSTYTKSKDALRRLRSFVPFAISIKFERPLGSVSTVQVAEAPLGQGPVHI